MIRPLVSGAVGIALVTAGALALLEIGLARPSSSDLTAARLARVLDVTRGRGAVISLDGARVRARCTRTSPGVIRVSLGATEIVASGPHVLQTAEVAGRTIAVQPVPDLAAAELDLSGSHAMYARQLGGALQRRSVDLVPTRYEGRDAYVVQLRQDRPQVALVVDVATLRPLAASYRSADLSGSSRLIGGGPRRTGC